MTATRIILFGGTDLTLSMAKTVKELGLELSGIVTVQQSFAISYSPGRPVTNDRFSDVAGWARENSIPCLVYSGLEGVRSFIRQCGGTLGLVAGWYHMIDRATRDTLPQGCLGLHASLLPKLRGGAPLNWAILTQAAEAGISLFELGDGIDDGPIYGQIGFPVGPRAPVADLIRESEAGAISLLRRCLPEIAAGKLKPVPQTGEATYGLQRKPDDSAIDWGQPAAAIDRLVRASGHPYSGAFSDLNGTRIRIWDVDLQSPAIVVWGRAGQIARIPEISQPCVVTGDGLVIVRSATEESGADAMPLLTRAANQRFTAVMRAVST